MKLSDVINQKYLDPYSLNNIYKNGSPFPHIVMDDFIKEDILKNVSREFPDLSKSKENVKQFHNNKEVKFGSKGMQILSTSALKLNSYLQSDLMLEWLNILTGIKEPLISDPYLSGGGYHEIKKNGFLKIHADFNKHPKMNLDRRLNMIVYLNEDWKNEWGGALHLFDQNMKSAKQMIYPKFNTTVIFSTTSFTFHGHPDPLDCPDDRSRRSLAYYYFSIGRPKNEVQKEIHGTIFKERYGEKFGKNFSIKSLIKDFIPPIFIKITKSLFKSR